MDDRFDRIFIVDDDEDAIEALSEMLLMDSFKVESAGSAEKALKKIKSWPAHLFIIDIRLPGMSGIELLKKLDIKNNVYEAIIVTGYAELESAKQAMQHGAFSYISKPLMYDELAPHINKALEVAALKKSKINHLNELEEKIRERTKELEKEIAEKKSAEKTLLRSEERYRRLFEESNDAIFIHNTLGEILSVNQAACDMLGYDFHTLTVLKIQMLHPPEEKQKAQKALHDIVKTGRMHFESRFKRADGTIIDVEISSKILTDNRSEDNLIQGIVRDITERKRAEDALREKEKLLSEQNALLQQKTAALREVMDQLEAEKERLGKQVHINAESLLIPLITHMRNKGSKLDKAYLDMLEENVKNLTSQFGNRVSDRMLRLTQKEINICTMIKSGLNSKAIAGLLNISNRTVETHRNNIRKKLGIGNQEVNLVTCLKNLA